MIFTYGYTCALFLLLNEVKVIYTKCGYEACSAGQVGLINVHLISHTHDDVGYWKTVDQYFYGTRNDIQNAGVQYILDSVVDGLERDQLRRFTYVEMAYFFRWWREQSDARRAAVRDLVAQGRLQFAIGAWVSPDEATSHYASVIDAHTIGLRLLRDNFGECGVPRVGWQVDPFGHSREYANLQALMGYDATFMARIDYEDSAVRSASREFETLWRGSDADPNADLFAHVLMRGYGQLDGFWWEVGRNDLPIMDDPLLEDYNVDERVDLFLQLVHEQITNGSDVRALYSTPACYTFAVHAARAGGWSEKRVDFMTYADRPNSFWSGYFTSRAAQKGFERLASGFLQLASQMNARAGTGLDKLGDESLFVLRDALAIIQHHDGISGTSKQHVANDYVKRIATGVKIAEEVVNKAFTKLALKASEEEFGAPPADQSFCWFLNESICSFTTDSAHFDGFLITVYNPASWSRSQWLRVPLRDEHYRVYNAAGEQVASQVMPVNPVTQRLWAANKYAAKLTAARFELIFQATAIPPLGWTTFRVRRSSSSYVLVSANHNRDSWRMENENVALEFESGRPSRMTQKRFGVSVAVLPSLRFYRSFQGPGQPSGIYVFRPSTNDSEELPLTGSSSATGPLVSEAYLEFGDWAALIMRLYAEDNHFEFEWTIGPVDIGINYRPTWRFENSEPVAGNYFPVPTRIFIQDPVTDEQFTVVTDRSEGGSSLAEGQIELMLHRRQLVDDNIGVFDPLNETGVSGDGLVVRGTHYLLLSRAASAARQHRDLAARLYLHAQAPFSPLPRNAPEEAQIKHILGQNSQFNWSGLTKALPPNLQILTLQEWDDGKLLLRLEHLYQPKEDEQLSQDVTIELDGLFRGYLLLGYQEVTLGANQLYDDWLINKLRWNIAAPALLTNEELQFMRDERQKLRTKGKLMKTPIVLTAAEIKTIIYYYAKL